jgi:sugar phosphate isomerase/epimerase
MLAGGRFHLTYCSNIHPGESWTAVRDVLATSLPRVREALAVRGPFGVGLRLSAAAAESLEEPLALAAFREFLDAGNYYVFTINGFPYGAFHGARVKENVYLPDWRDPRRVDYSDRLARILAMVMKDGDGTISTVPGAFRSEVRSAADAQAIAAGIRAHVATLREIHQRMGKKIWLALEPEPACFLETIDDAIGFFREHLDEVRDHVGICLDTCHMAVEYEDPADAFARLRAEGIRVPKVQITSALRVSPSPAGIEALRRFADDVYLHQVVARCGGSLDRFTDLPDAFASRATTCDEWRVHFHVPLFMDALPPLSTTQAYVADVIALLRRDAMTPHLEVETYTWDVLPEQYRGEDKCSAIAREIDWVRSRLA